jgi:hypothetical protein
MIILLEYCFPLISVRVVMNVPAGELLVCSLERAAGNVHITVLKI